MEDVSSCSDDPDTSRSNANDDPSFSGTRTDSSDTENVSTVNTAAIGAHLLRVAKELGVDSLQTTDDASSLATSVDDKISSLQIELNEIVSSSHPTLGDAFKFTRNLQEKTKTTQNELDRVVSVLNSDESFPALEKAAFEGERADSLTLDEMQRKFNAIQVVAQFYDRIAAAEDAATLVEAHAALCACADALDGMECGSDEFKAKIKTCLVLDVAKRKTRLLRCCKEKLDAAVQLSNRVDDGSVEIKVSFEACSPHSLGDVMKTLQVSNTLHDASRTLISEMDSIVLEAVTRGSVVRSETATKSVAKLRLSYPTPQKDAWTFKDVLDATLEAYRFVDLHACAGDRSLTVSTCFSSYVDSTLPRLVDALVDDSSERMDVDCAEFDDNMALLLGESIPKLTNAAADVPRRLRMRSLASDLFELREILNQHPEETCSLYDVAACAPYWTNAESNFYVSERRVSYCVNAFLTRLLEMMRKSGVRPLGPQALRLFRLAPPLEHRARPTSRAHAVRRNDVEAAVSFAMLAPLILRSTETLLDCVPRLRTCVLDLRAEQLENALKDLEIVFRDAPASDEERVERFSTCASKFAELDQNWRRVLSVEAHESLRKKVGQKLLNDAAVADVLSRRGPSPTSRGRMRLSKAMRALREVFGPDVEDVRFKNVLMCLEPHMSKRIVEDNASELGGLSTEEIASAASFLYGDDDE